MSIASIVCRLSLASMIGLAVASIDCNKPLPPNSPLPADVRAEAECVAERIIGGETSVDALVSCVGGDFAILKDVLDWLLSSPSFVAKVKPETLQKLHTDAIAAIARHLHPDGGT